MGPFLTFLALELQKGHLYLNWVEFHQEEEVIGADINLFRILFTMPISTHSSSQVKFI